MLTNGVANQAMDIASQERLLLALAEQIKSPLLHIARLSELAQKKEVDEHLQTIEYTAAMTLGLVDSYLLGIQLAGQQELALEPVALSAVLQDAAHAVSGMAKQYNCDVEVVLAGKYGPVMANKQSLEAAFISLASSFVQSVPEQEKRHRIMLVVRKTPATTIAAGVFGAQPLTAAMFRRAKILYGSAQNALPQFTATSGAGIILADALLQTMASSLKVSHFHKHNGLAAELIPSTQLQLV